MSRFSEQKYLRIVIVFKLHACWAWAKSILHNYILMFFYLNIIGKGENACREAVALSSDV